MKSKKTYLTAEQMAALAPYEANMETAVKSDWTRGLGRNGALLMGRISSEVTGGPSHVNLACPDCVLDVCRRVGRWYFDTKERDAAKAAENATKTAESQPSSPAPARTAKKKGKAAKNA